MGTTIAGRPRWSIEVSNCVVVLSNIVVAAAGFADAQNVQIRQTVLRNEVGSALQDEKSFQAGKLGDVGRQVGR